MNSRACMKYGKVCVWACLSDSELAGRKFSSCLAKNLYLTLDLELVFQNSKVLSFIDYLPYC